MGLSTRILDHATIDVYSHDLYFGIRVCHIENRSPRATGNIEDSIHASDIISLWEQATHALGKEAILLRQAGHLRGTLGIQDVGVFFCCWGVGGHNETPFPVVALAFSCKRAGRGKPRPYHTRCRLHRCLGLLYYGAGGAAMF